MNSRILFTAMILMVSHGCRGQAIMAIDGGTQTPTSDTLLEIIPADEIRNALNEAPSPAAQSERPSNHAGSIEGVGLRLARYKVRTNAVLSLGICGMETGRELRPGTGRGFYPSNPRVLPPAPAFRRQYDSISGENSEYVMIFGPRDEGELKTIWIIAQISYYQARGLNMEPKSSTATPSASWGQAKGDLIHE